MFLLNFFPVGRVLFLLLSPTFPSLLSFSAPFLFAVKGPLGVEGSSVSSISGSG